MPGHQVSPENLSSAKPHHDPQADETIKFKDMELPVRPWAVACLSLLVVLLASCLGGIYVWKNWNEAKAQIHDLNTQKEKLEKIKTDSEQATLAKLQEYKNHFKEKGQVLTTPEASLKITAYSSDGCILINRKDAN